MEREILTTREIEKFCLKDNVCQIENNKLYCSLKFKSFSRAMAFMMELSIYCEKINHHPE